jgi:DNA invertase Pin-like site-specific DNA recombinase
MKVALYARVSSEQQAEKDLSIPAQLKALNNYD